MNQQIELVLTVGQWLSGGAFLLVALVLVNVWRRDAFPEVSYGGIRLTRRRLRWVWTGVVLGSLALGVMEDPVAHRTEITSDDEVREAATSLRTRSMNVPLPFYRYERETTTAPEGLVEDVVLEGFVIPWPLFGGLLAYFFLVMRWDPENRWALRILRGRRHREEKDGDDHG